ncbi:M64 family metallopeptidase [Ancylomarina longa]|uniref:Peptidase n=1 Tax=Ancylomarina longa TaxID=2487017 RepID=A0A434AFA0_9BACT|nr:M64 family metallopeptidase [Ancylomarina longa]RUT73091.1 peptidase [Ancylomarina longa]
MKTLLTTLLILLAEFGFGQNLFEKNFENKTLRIDYVMGGDADTQTVFLKEMKKEPFWGGSKKNLIDPFGYGNFRFKLLDAESHELLYSKGFNSLFQEWQTTAEAKELKRAFYQVNVMPFPKRPVLFVLEWRNKQGKMKQIFQYRIDPKNYFIRKEVPTPVHSTLVSGNGDPSESIDVAFIAEGYTANEMDKFKADVKRLSGYIFDVAPFDKYKDRFNIYALESISKDSGTDIPGDSIYKNTAVNTSFYTFDIKRYLTTVDIKALHDIAANVPYDQIYVVINTDLYGGGGFYNYYTSCSADNKLSYEVSSHEFGHGFVGLADEYYNSSVAYDGFYNPEVEPWEPNLTTLVDFGKKWKNLMDKDTPIPTPRTEAFKNKIGVYEGGGYVSKGVYSPYQDCKMKSNKMKKFCPVCENAVEKMILYYLGE